MLGALVRKGRKLYPDWADWIRCLDFTSSALRLMLETSADSVQRFQLQFFYTMKTRETPRTLILPHELGVIPEEVPILSSCLPVDADDTVSFAIRSIIVAVPCIMQASASSVNAGVERPNCNKGVLF